MSKQFIVDVIKQKGKRIIVYSDAHANVCAFFDGDPEPIVGDEVDCPVCADLKAARLKELLNLIRKMVRGKLLRNPYHKNRLDSTREHRAYLKAMDELLSFLNDRIAELEKV